MDASEEIRQLKIRVEALEKTNKSMMRVSEMVESWAKATEGQVTLYAELEQKINRRLDDLDLLKNQEPVDVSFAERAQSLQQYMWCPDQ